jgi:hypothetical protein
VEPSVLQGLVDGTSRADVADVRTSVVYQHLVSRPVASRQPGRALGGL